MIKVIVNTDVFKAQEWDNKIRRTLGKEGSRGVNMLKSATPVDTGLLKRRWDFSTSRLGIEFSNLTPYANFVDKGTVKMKARNITKNTIPLIEKRLDEQLASSIETIK